MVPMHNTVVQDRVLAACSGTAVDLACCARVRSICMKEGWVRTLPQIISNLKIFPLSFNECVFICLSARTWSLVEGVTCLCCSTAHRLQMEKAGE